MTCQCHLVHRGGCNQGRACPVRETELANAVGPDASRTFRPAPKLARSMSPWVVIILCAFLLLGWIAGSIYYVRSGGSLS